MFFINRIQPLSGKVTSVSQIVQDTSTAGGERQGEGQTPEREDEEGREGGGEKREYGGGRFAGVGDFEPAVEQGSRKKRADLPLFKSKPEAALRYKL